LMSSAENPSLRPAQQLVPAEGDDIHARFQADRDQRLVLHSKARQVFEAAAAQVLDQQQLMLSCKLDQLGELRALGKSHNAKIAGMDAHQDARALVDCRSVI